ncbi:MAG: hypothetical protein RIC80_14190 [Cyclobacteriaceae bacterium]
MIQFFLDRDNTYTMANYLGYRGSSIRPLFEIIPYQRLSTLEKVNCSTLIFTDLDWLTDEQRGSLTTLADHLSAEHGPLIFNHPAKVLSRYDLLRELFTVGINVHNVYLLSESMENVQFPVFLRHKDQHTGPLTPLLYDLDQIARQVKLLMLSGHQRQELMVVKYVDVGTDTGIYKKFSALRIGEQIVPRHLGYDEQWLVKANGNRDHKKTEMYLEEFYDYMSEFPHRDWVAKVFAIAGIDYGRIDYGIRGDQLVAWEINLNPDYGSGNKRRNRDDPSLIKELKTKNHELIKEIFSDLANGHNVEVSIPRNLIPAKSFSQSRGFRDRLRYLFKKISVRIPFTKMALTTYRQLLRKILKL